jgi:hypothetical protein
MDINGRTNIQRIDKKKVALTPKKADNETGVKLVFRAPIVYRRWLSSCRKPCG